MRQFRLINQRTGNVVSARALEATNSLTRMRGLLGRATMVPDEALILRPASSIHTWFMRFAIDVIYLDKEMKVRKIVPRLAPFRLSWSPGAHCVIEMAAGALASQPVALADQLRLEPAELEAPAS